MIGSLLFLQTFFFNRYKILSYLFLLTRMSNIVFMDEVPRKELFTTIEQ